MKSVTVVCPVYNEEEVIGRFYTELKNVLNSINGDYNSTILFVVDRCDDGTLDILKNISQQDHSVKILSLSSRFGHQMSLLAGIDHSDSDVVIMMDSDLQHPPALIKELLDKHIEGFDIVYTIRRDDKSAGYFKRACATAFYLFLNCVSHVQIQVNAPDFRLISRKVAQVFKTQIRERSLFMRGLISWVGFKRTGVMFTSETRQAGKSKYTFLKSISFATQGIISFSNRPLQAAMLVGFIFALFGIVNALWTIWIYIFYDVMPAGWATIVVLISFFSGVQLIFLGVIGEYIGAIFEEVKNRPLYIIEEKFNFDRK